MLALTVLSVGASPGLMHVMAQPTQSKEGVTPPPSADAPYPRKRPVPAVAQIQMPSHRGLSRKAVTTQYKPAGALG